MLLCGVNGQGSPLRVVRLSGLGIVRRRGRVGGDGCDGLHAAQANDAFDCEICLVDKLAGEVVSRKLETG